MGAIEKIVGTMLVLVALYLVLANSSAFNTILRSLSSFNVAVLGTLQGREVKTQDGVTLGGNSIGGSRGSGFGSGFGGLGSAGIF